MTDAWMQRGSERQEFLDQLKSAIMDEEEESHKRLTIQIPFTISILHHLGEREGVVFNLYRDSPAWTFFYEKVLPQIKEFARTPEEEAFLVTELLIWEIASLTNLPRLSLTTQEMSHPELLFDGHQAMDKV